MEKTIFNSREEFAYSDYVEDCEINGIEPKEEGSYEFDEWCAETSRTYVEDELTNMRYTKVKDYPFYIDGTLGLWFGKREGHCTKVFYGLAEAIEHILGNGYDDFMATYDDEAGVVYVYGYHHDGTNTYTIHLLSSRGEAKVNNDIANGNINSYDYEPKAYCFKKLKEREIFG